MMKGKNMKKIKDKKTRILYLKENVIKIPILTREFSSIDATSKSE